MYNENEIWNQLKQKDRSAFELLFRTHYEPLVGFVFKYLGNQPEAEEVVQDVYFQLWKKLDEVEIETSIKSYLYQAARNKSLNIIKHRIVQRKYEEHVQFHDSPFDSTNQIEVDELQERIQKAIDTLPEKCREVFLLSRFEEKKYKEIAEELGISIKTVENQMGKALKVLRGELADYLPMMVLFAMELIILESQIGVNPFEIV
ncbi:MAG: RNA polymerase sigma-70 factor [Flavobacteriales bacterium]|nr:RNA polymerase sigma-70 factor [Flavobacteriales bacterium]